MTLNKCASSQLCKCRRLAQEQLRLERRRAAMLASLKVQIEPAESLRKDRRTMRHRAATAQRRLEPLAEGRRDRSEQTSPRGANKIVGEKRVIES
jgi:hypothetical protein